MEIACNLHPDHDTLAHCRRRFGAEFQAAFVQVLQVARENQLSRFGTVSLDGTKVHANASKHSALSYGHAEKIEAQLEADVGQRVRIDLIVYFGLPTQETADGLEAVYENLLRLETEIREAVLFTAVRAAGGRRLRVRAVETLFDEDRLPHYKLMASRFEVEG